METCFDLRGPRASPLVSHRWWFFTPGVVACRGPVWEWESHCPRVLHCLHCRGSEIDLWQAPTCPTRIWLPCSQSLSDARYIGKTLLRSPKTWTKNARESLRERTLLGIIHVTLRNLDVLSAHWATCVGTALHGFGSRLIVLWEQTPFTLCVSFFQHERTPYFQIISPDLSVTGLCHVTLMIWNFNTRVWNCNQTVWNQHYVCDNTHLDGVKNTINGMKTWQSVNSK
jgi:hypothetical protein